MKLTLACLLFLTIAIQLTTWSKEPVKKTESIRVEALQQMDVIGALGVPLGRAVEIEATIISGDSLRMKAFQGDYLLQVNSVDGTALEKAQTLPFKLKSWAQTNLAVDNFELYKLKKGRKAAKLDDEQIKELEKDYVGRLVKLVVYEGGEFDGVPQRLPKDAPIWADYGFGLRTHLIVVTQRK